MPQTCQRIVTLLPQSCGRLRAFRVKNGFINWLEVSMCAMQGRRRVTAALVSVLAGVTLLGLGLVGCGGGAKGPEQVKLNGAGATFPYPLYSKWVSSYEAVAPTVRINYQSIGSGGGIRQVTEKTVDFGASDAPMSDEQLGKAPAPLVHIPTTLGAVVVTYNVPGVAAGLKLTQEAVAGIFLGEITRWNDPKLVGDNPGVTLPDQAIAVVHRTDGSGTTAVFTQYLSAISPVWKEKVGAGTSVSWPVGLGGKGNEGVAGQIKSTAGALGYVELAYAMQSGLTSAQIRNQAGQFVTASVESISAAAAGTVASLPDDFRVSIVDAGGEQSYPISAYTYLLVYADNPDAAKGNAIAQFLWWALHEGQAQCVPLHYAPLPAEVVAKVEGRIKGLKAAGQPVQVGGVAAP